MAQDTVVPPPSAEVSVVGERPGPRLWRISSQRSTLWILGTQTPLPKNMKWRSAEVEAVIRSSDEVLGAYSVSLSTDGLPQFEAQSLPKALPKKVYARWTAMRDQYIDRRLPTDHLLPATAALFLQSQAYEKSGLTTTDDVWRTIYGLARLHHVRVRPQSHEVHQESTEKVSEREARKAGVRFLVETMDRLESDLTTSGRRANAWANGDMTTLLQLAPSDESYAASFAQSWPFLSPEEAERLIEKEDTRLAANFARALNRNRTTFAAVPMYLLMKKDGPLSILSASGFDVQQPDDRDDDQG